MRTPAGSFRFQLAGTTTRVVAAPGALDVLSAELPRIAPGRWVVISSVPVFRLHGEALFAGALGARLDLEPVLVPDGERAKTWVVLGRTVEALVARGLRRDGGVVALGGGTVGDVAGMAASLVLRGVPVVQAPTTLLAASDSALGGKTAVDLPAGKNLAGTFHHPRLVAVDPSLLATLTDRDFRSGLAEVVKSALLDRAFWKRFPVLAADLVRRDARATGEAVLRSLRMKARVVESDPCEARGLRHALNLGHTVGHALERASSHRLAHGEAVAWGLLAALVLSERRAGLSPSVSSRAALWVRALCAAPVPSRRALATWPGFLGADKKGDARGLRAVVLRAPGDAILVRTEAAELEEAFGEASRRYNTEVDG